VKFTPHGSIVLSAWANLGGQSFGIRVRDTGIGIPEEEIPHLIEGVVHPPSADESQHHGLGLGLRMASRLTEFLGGTLRVESQAGAGTQFTVTLPKEPPLRPKEAAQS
jgi:signal transduction histidine kinase